LIKKKRKVRFHPHAIERIHERGTNEKEVTSAIQNGETFSAKFGRTGFRRNFRLKVIGEASIMKPNNLEVYAVEEGEGWSVITVITKILLKRVRYETYL